jgi:catechol 2,3-dioxygenase-like lactoylglutathione lyase family enzyme
MIANITLHVSNYKRAKEFYAAALAPLGYRNNMEYGESAGFNDGKNTDFWVTSTTE